MSYPLKNAKLFHWWCNKVLPLVYDDSLSYYETLCKIMSTIKDLIEVEELQNNAITDLDRRVTTAEEDIDNLEGRMDTAESDIDSLEGRMDTAENDIDDLIGRMDTAENDIDNLEDRMDTAESDINENTNEINGLKTRMSTAEGDIDSLEGRMSTAESGISGLQSAMTNMDSRVNQLTGRVTEAEGDIDDLESDVTSIQSDITSINQHDTLQDGDINYLKSKATATDSAISSLTAGLTNTNTRVTNTEGAINGLSAELAAVNNRVTGLEPVDYLTVEDKNVSGKALYRAITGGSLINGALGTASLDTVGRQEYGGYYEYNSTSPDFGNFVVANVWETERINLEVGLQYWVGGVDNPDDIVVVCYDENDDVIATYTTNNSGLYIEDVLVPASYKYYKFLVPNGCEYVRIIFPWETATLDAKQIAPYGFVTNIGDMPVTKPYDEFPVGSSRMSMYGDHIQNMLSCIYAVFGSTMYNPANAYTAGQYVHFGSTLFRITANTTAGEYWATSGKFERVSFVDMIEALKTQLGGYTIAPVQTQAQYDAMGSYDPNTIYPIVG